MHRGDRSEPIFRDKGDQAFFVETLGGSLSAERLAKEDEEKVEIAVPLKRETLVTEARIDKRLHLRSVANVNTLLFHWRRGKQK